MSKWGMVSSADVLRKFEHDPEPEAHMKYPWFYTLDDPKPEFRDDHPKGPIVAMNEYLQERLRYDIETELWEALFGRPA